VHLYRYFVSQSSEFCQHDSLCCFSTSVYFCKRVFPYGFSPETFGYTLVHTLLILKWILEQCYEGLWLRMAEFCDDPD